jgi:hypothetical protein
VAPYDRARVVNWEGYGGTIPYHCPPARMYEDHSRFLKWMISLPVFRNETRHFRYRRDAKVHSNASRKRKLVTCEEKKQDV